MYIRSLTISSISHYTFFFLYYPKAHTTGRLENSLYIFVFLFNFLSILNFFISFFTLFYINSFLLHMRIIIFSCIIYFFSMPFFYVWYNQSITYWVCISFLRFLSLLHRERYGVKKWSFVYVHNALKEQQWHTIIPIVWFWKWEKN